MRRLPQKRRLCVKPKANRSSCGRTTDVTAKLLNDYDANEKTFKVHLDGFNLIPFFKGEAKEAWDNLVANDQEEGPMIMQPAVGNYGRMRR